MSRRGESATSCAHDTGDDVALHAGKTTTVRMLIGVIGPDDGRIAVTLDGADNGFPCYPLFTQDAQLDGLRTDRG